MKYEKEMPESPQQVLQMLLFRLHRPRPEYYWIGQTMYVGLTMSVLYQTPSTERMAKQVNTRMYKDIWSNFTSQIVYSVSRVDR